MLIRTSYQAGELYIPKSDTIDEDDGITYGKHPFYTQRSKRLAIDYSYIRAGGRIHPS